MKKWAQEKGHKKKEGGKRTEGCKNRRVDELSQEREEDVDVAQ